MLMAALGQTETHEAEIFCPGRFAVRARRFDLRARHCDGPSYRVRFQQGS